MSRSPVKTRLEAERTLRQLLSVEQEEEVNTDEVLNVLVNFKSIKLSKFKGSNLFIVAVLRQDIIFLGFLVKYFCDKNGLLEQGLEDKESYLEYLNQPNRLGFTALSYATYFEFEDIAESLIELGANVNHVNNDGDSILVLAAKGGSLRVLMNLYSLGISPWNRKNGNLSLVHFACFEGNLHILKWLIKINELEGRKKSDLFDCDCKTGETALHMGVSSGEYAVVKYLLIQGVDKQVKCNQGMTALQKTEYMKSSGELDENIADSLISLLSDDIPLKQRIKLQTKIQPGINRYHTQLLVTNTLTIIASILVMPNLLYQKLVIPLYLGFQFLALLMLLLSRTNPGFMEKFGYRNFGRINSLTQYLSRSSMTISTTTGSNNQLSDKNISEMNISNRDKQDQAVISKKDVFLSNFKMLMKYHEYEELCLECCIRKPVRSKHCDFCNQCVSVMDHHCPFVGNCIGSKNHKYFFSMLICYAVTVLLLLTMCGLICYDFFAEPLNSNSDLLFEKITELDILGRTYSFVVAIVLSVICMIVAVPLSFMVYAQVTILCSGMTTLEMRTKGRFTEKASQEIDDTEPITDAIERTKSKQYIEYSSRHSTAQNNNFNNEGGIASRAVSRKSTPIEYAIPNYSTAGMSSNSKNYNSNSVSSQKNNTRNSLSIQHQSNNNNNNNNNVNSQCDDYCNNINIEQCQNTNTNNNNSSSLSKQPIQVELVRSKQNSHASNLGGGQHTKKEELTANKRNSSGMVELEDAANMKTISRRSEIDYNQQSRNSRISNAIDILFRNANNPIYFVSEIEHSQIFLGSKPLDSNNNRDASNLQDISLSISETLIKANFKNNLQSSRSANN